MNFLKAFKLTLFTWRWSWQRIKRNFQQKFLLKILLHKTITDFTAKVSNSYTFTCKFPKVMHFVLVLHKCCESENNSYVLVATKLLVVKSSEKVSDCSSQYSRRNSNNRLSELCEKENRYRFVVAFICIYRENRLATGKIAWWTIRKNKNFRKLFGKSGKTQAYPYHR